ncbi:hypothetical protein P3342_008989 [Pyrenophora teres f. teres]|nr:hypothetical protein P3342_008989 [Pyrenophora teres f. teres]
MLSQYRFRGFPVIDNSRDALLLGYISRTELQYALQTAVTPPRDLAAETEAYFAHQPLSDPTTSLDLRPWMDQTPITLNARASFQLTVSMFQKLGLRYVLFTDRGMLKGLLTKKDVWYVLNGMEEDNEDASAGEDTRRGRLREGGDDEEDSEEAGLLSTPDEELDVSLGAQGR